MSSGDTRAKRRRRRKKKAEESGTSWFRWLLYGVSFLALLALIGAVGTYLYFAHGLPNFRTLADYQPPQMSRVYAADGTSIGELFTERRTLVGREEIPEVLINAVLSAEDAAFYEHQGLDYLGMLRAIYNGLKAGRVKGSGSTITQQTVKNLLLTSEKSFKRKFREIILARRLEAELSKDDILTIYLNAIYLGHGRYGVQEASRFYFGRDVSQMNLNQAATLAGLIQAPNGHSPRRDMKRALRRRAYVLKQMVKNGFIKQASADAVLKKPIELGPVYRKPPAHYNWFVDIVRRRLVTRLGEQMVMRGGLKIQTPLDPRRQEAAVHALQQGLTQLDRRRGYGRSRKTVPARRVKAWRKKRARVLKGKPPGMGATVKARVMEIKRASYILDLGIGTAALPARSVDRLVKAHKTKPKVGDILTVQLRSDGPRHPARMNAVLAGQPQGSFIALSNEGRDVLAMVGGWDYRDSPFNRTTQAKRQPGSAIKPFIYGAAIEDKRYAPASIKVDSPVTKKVGRGKFWQPKNHSGKYLGPISLRTSLARSVNTIPAELTDEIGVPKVQEFAKRLGIKSPMASGLAISLGASEVTALELTNAYAAIATDGHARAPRLITRVVKPDGEIIAPAIEPAADGIDGNVAYLIRSMLRSVVTDGTGRKLKSIKREVIGKTGTSQESRDNWFVGSVPEVSFSIWVGFDSNRGIRKTSGKKPENSTTTAVPIAHTYLAQAEENGRDWPEPPDGIVSRKVVIRDAAPRLACGDEEDGSDEFFLRGTEPRDCARTVGDLGASDFLDDEDDDDEADDPGLILAPSTPTRVRLAPSLKPAKPTRTLDEGDSSGSVPMVPRVSQDEDLPP